MSRRAWFVHFLKCSLRERKGRVAVASLAVTLATAIVVGALGLSLGIRQQLGGELKAYGANVIVSKADGFLDENVLGAVAAVPGVQEHSAQLYGRAWIDGTGVEVIGIQAEREAARGRLKVTGDWPTLGQALPGVDLALALKLGPGGTVSPAGLEGGDKVALLKVSGTVQSGGPEDSALFMGLSDAQALLGRQGLISAVLIRAPSSEIDATVQALMAAVPGAEVRTRREVAKAEEVFLAKIELLLLLVTAVVLVATAICVSSTMSATVLERMKEIGLMKAIGGTRTEIRSFYIAEGLAIGLMGGITGYVLGYMGTLAVSHGAFGSFIGVPPYVLVLSVAMGIIISVLSSMLPVGRALGASASVILRGE